jgi:hypothetical protein
MTRCCAQQLILEEKCRSYCGTSEAGYSGNGERCSCPQDAGKQVRFVWLQKVAEESTELSESLVQRILLLLLVTKPNSPAYLRLQPRFPDSLIRPEAVDHHFTAGVAEHNLLLTQQDMCRVNR